MQSDGVSRSPVSPFESSRENSMDGPPPPSMTANHYYGPVTIHLHGLTSVHIHRHSDDTTPLTGTTKGSDFAATNTYKIPRKPLPTSGRPNKHRTNASLKYGPLPSSVRREESGKQEQSQQQGALNWNGTDDPDNPECWSSRKKIYHTIVPSAIAFLTTFASTIYVLARDEVVAEFDVSTTVSILPYSLYTLGIAFGPITAAPFSEAYGRRRVYLCSIPLFAAFIAGAGASPNIESLIICRFFAGLFASPGLAIGTGTIADVWPLALRAIPIAAYTTMPLLGPTIGPLVGGFVVVKKGWRWTQWIILLLTAMIYILALFMKETYKKVILRRRARHDSTDNISKAARFVATLKESMDVTCIRPLHMLVVEPVVLAFSIYQFFILAFFYTLNATIPYVFLTVYQFDSSLQGLVYLGFAVGFLLGFLTALVAVRLKMRKIRVAAAKGIRTKAPPEVRLQLTRIAGMVLPVGIFWWGWSLQAQVHWICPLAAMVVIGWALYLIIMTLALYVVDCYGARIAASAVSATRISGYVGGAVFPLFAIQMFENLTIGWASSLLGFIAVALSLIPLAFSRYGEHLRAKGRYRG